ncbi:helix-turn-helix domain-containing protein [Desulforudis sp. DRI-14]|uniref:helix-turn-helix domain-containing protein n=1 Tax=Desulforudis sp. DRI-14 TaxID=3459793 RepID=UPI003BD67620
MFRPPTYAEIGERIRALREQHGLTQDELARAIDVSRPVVTKIEAGKKALSSLELRRIADRLGTSTDYLTRNVEEGNMLGRFRTGAETGGEELKDCLPEIERLVVEVLGQIRMWRKNRNGC